VEFLQEFFALGVANFGSSFFHCFPATASLSRASVMGELSKTQLSSLISCSILLQILLFLAPVLTDLPKVNSIVSLPFPEIKLITINRLSISVRSV
jgi:MFS superfamily sulfate permease-like transporter